MPATATRLRRRTTPRSTKAVQPPEGGELWCEFTKTSTYWSFTPMRDGEPVRLFRLAWNDYWGPYKDRPKAVEAARRRFPGARLLTRDGRGWKELGLR